MVKASGERRAMSSKVNSSWRMSSASFGLFSSKTCSTLSESARSILLMMSASFEWMETTVLRPTFTSNSSATVSSRMRRGFSLTGLIAKRRRTTSFCRFIGNCFNTEAAKFEGVRDNSRAVAWGCSLTKCCVSVGIGSSTSRDHTGPAPFLFRMPAMISCSLSGGMIPESRPSTCSAVALTPPPVLMELANSSISASTVAFGT